MLSEPERERIEYVLTVTADHRTGGYVPSFDDVATTIADAILATQNRELPGWGISAIGGFRVSWEQMSLDTSA